MIQAPSTESSFDENPATARGLANSAYTTQAQLDIERQTLLAGSWIPIAVEEDVPVVGDVYPVSAAGQPLLVLRADDGNLRVFHNVCRHRGTCLVNRAGRRASLVCPYHGWTYGLDGSLEQTPYFGGPYARDTGSIDKAKHSLSPVQFGVWNHIVFANLNGTAERLAQRMSPLSARWQHVDFSCIRHGQEAHYEVAANWKLVTENFLESYHLPSVHRDLNTYSALAHHHVIVEGSSHFGQQSTQYVPADGAARQLPQFPNLDRKQSETAEYLCLFPTAWLSITADHFRVTLVEPVSPNLTRIRWVFYFVGDEALEPSYAPIRQTLVTRVLSVFEEDVSILERLQLGRTSRSFDGGCFSAFHEGGVHRFQQLVASSYESQEKS